MNIISQLLIIFLAFAKKPNNIRLEGETNRINLFIFVFIVNLVVFASIQALTLFFHYFEKMLKVKEGMLILSSTPNILNISLPTSIILICLVGPLVEEIIYRLPLLKRYFFILPLSIAFVIFNLSGQNIFSTILLAFLILAIILFVFWVFIDWKNKRNSKFILFYINSIYGKNYTHFFYFITLFFCLTHIDNYNWTLYNLTYGIIIFTISFITDFSFGYLMIRCGFFYTLALHSIWNLLMFTIDKFM